MKPNLLDKSNSRLAGPVDLPTRPSFTFLQLPQSAKPGLLGNQRSEDAGEGTEDARCQQPPEVAAVAEKESRQRRRNLAGISQKTYRQEIDSPFGRARRSAVLWVDR